MRQPHPKFILYFLPLQLFLTLTLSIKCSPIELPNESQFYDVLAKQQSNKKARIDTQDISTTIDKDKRLRVIVQFRAERASFAESNLRSETAKRRVRDSVRRDMDPVLGKLSPGEVSIRARLAYSPVVAAAVTPSGLEALLTHEDVEFVVEDRLVKPMTAQGLTLIDPGLVRTRYDGRGVAIALLDTGIDYRHPILGNGRFPNDKILGGIDIGDNDPDPLDRFGHGTACAGILTGNSPPDGSAGDYTGGVAPGAKLYAVKISHADDYGIPTGYAWFSDILQGVEWSITHQLDDPANPIVVANISFGLGGYTDACDADSYASVGTQTISNAIKAGITVFASSGNTGYTNALCLPACYSEVIAVGAVYDSTSGPISHGTCSDTAEVDTIACYSNSSENLDLLAPGHTTSTTDSLGSDGNSPGDYDAMFGGTSASSPYAAGSAAVLQAAYFLHRGEHITPLTVKTILASTGDPIQDGRNNIITPRVNLESAVRSLFAPGDGNGDGLLDTEDAVVSLTVTGGVDTDRATYFGDWNDDGRLGVEDAIYGLRYAAGKICTAEHLEACISFEDCEAIDGFWYDDECHMTPACDAGHLEQCDSGRACTFVGGFWLEQASTCIVDPHLEKEPNDTQELSNPLYLDVPVTARLGSISDRDWFELHLSEPMVGSVTFSASVTSTFWFISIYDSNGNLLGRHDVGNNDDFDVAFPQAGTYSFVVTFDSTYNADAYTLAVSTNDELHLNQIETEGNGDKLTADQITLGQSITGQLMDIDDQDWFVLQVDAPLDVTVSFSTAVASTYWFVAVYDESGNELARNDVGNGGNFALSLPEAGSYSFVVTCDSTFSDDQYALTVSVDGGKS